MTMMDHEGAGEGSHGLFVDSARTTLKDSTLIELRLYPIKLVKASQLMPSADKFGRSRRA